MASTLEPEAWDGLGVGVQKVALCTYCVQMCMYRAEEDPARDILKSNSGGLKDGDHPANQGLEYVSATGVTIATGSVMKLCNI